MLMGQHLLFTSLILKLTLKNKILHRKQFQNITIFIQMLLKIKMALVSQIFTTKLQTPQK